MMLINYEAQEIWPMFSRDKLSLLSRMRVLAENPEYGVVIYLTAEAKEGSLYPSIEVYFDDDEIYSELAVSEQDCKNTVSKIYREYLDDEKLFNVAMEKLYGDAPSATGEEDDDREAEINDREDELTDAVYEFIHVALDKSPASSFDDEMIEDCKEHFLEYIARKWAARVYRPMVLEDDKGEFFEEYPYEHIEFGDNNPIYD